ncbi:hypothetical protein ACJMK2_036603 [Sinanodonta woodiana]|uniref:MULE transposase domain-containing protein n=1 Tax=Sinanodonta woodiana TaxID=1069815 RepID=A0ABD3WL99_SINWO
MDGTVLGVDKTINLGEMYLTSTVLKNQALLRNDTGESHIFFSPSFLHGKSDFETYNAFFSQIASQFTDEEIENMVVGSDEETAIRKSLRRSFPGVTQIVCTLHLKKNVTDYLKNMVGVNVQDRKSVLNTLFGDEGITQADNSVVLDERIKHATDIISEKASGFQPYFEKRMLPILKDHVNYPSRVKNVDAHWTNNNAESVNNIMKIGTNWKQKNISDLIDILQSIVSSQYKDAKRALIEFGRGNFKLASSYMHHRVSIDAWCQETETEQQAIFRKFFKDKGITKLTVRSTNGKITIPKTPSGGKNPHQRKRMRAERSQTRTK